MPIDAPYVLIAAVLWYLIFLRPIIRIVQRTGHSGWAALWLFVPGANIVALNALAYGRWPVLGDRPADN